MSLAGALSVLRPTLPYSLALARRGLPRLKPDGFEPRPGLAAPPLALEMVRDACGSPGRVTAWGDPANCHNSARQ